MRDILFWNIRTVFAGHVTRTRGKTRSNWVVELRKDWIVIGTAWKRSRTREISTH